VRKIFAGDFVFQVVALLAAAILVHSLYALWIRPRANAILAEGAARMKGDPTYVQERSAWVVLRDYEQESCFVLMLWALAILGRKGAATTRERRLAGEDLIPLGEGTKILPEDAREYARQIQSLPDPQRGALLPRALLAALHRFSATRSIQDVSATAHGLCQAEAERLESELSMLRYIAWAIPAIGFIGTVRGIGDALAQAHKAVVGEIAGVTESLGVAFNSTLIALLLSIVLMFLLHQLQLQQERLVQETEAYLDQRLIQHLQVSS
jgi:biopolymer transport protein ExbB/TolQ